MTDTREFLGRFRETARSLGSQRLLTPTDVIGSWRGFVEECEEGYADNIYEFANDLAVRDLIRKILDSEELRTYSQMGWVRDEVAEIDGRYRAILLDDEVRPGRPWWEARVPRLAGEELAGDFASSYGVSVTVVS
ncbi:hypothetical protein [Kribbella sindirgiensis]|uniref:Uncharacterized protein n=1 Tax=Kribbella sindirgiensis TaxID=1124744 RepID=A0A4R0IAV8_9ACTN|nr:hypothetical protein [Kribbella sindirgiensis]TCC19247.1 hypothetical protein E0H50_38100 [Kribbella sindirgiensis]